MRLKLVIRFSLIYDARNDCESNVYYVYKIESNYQMDSHPRIFLSLADFLEMASNGIFYK